jgi:OOP family OmpA-OmpF porin
MNFRNALVAATMLALPMAAHAQPVNGLYIAGGLGGTYMQDLDASAADVSGKLPSNIGAAGMVSLGYGLGNGLRFELEGDYRANSLTTGTNGFTTGGGQEQKMGVMGNVLYEGHTQARNDTQGGFAYQAILGVAVPIASAPGLAVTADYRFMGVTGTRTYDGTPFNIALSQDFSHTILVGVRYAFGAAPAPAPAAPAPVAAAPSPVSRSYIVFFDWDKANLTTRARQIVSEAAANSTKVQYTRLEVNGYTDTSGKATYNQGLSVRRAQAVAAELVKDGVPKSAITIQGFGETNPLVPTGANVREPQNRRVEIIIK